MIILLNNSKGGVAKTTSVAVMSQILAAAGYKVLVVDLDPQGNVSGMLGTESKRNCVKKEKDGFTISLSNESILTDAMTKEELKEFIVTTDFLDIDIIPAEEEMYNIIYRMHDEYKKDPDSILILRDNLKQMEEYDYILIDSSPFKTPLIDAGICAADRVYVPVEADNLSYEGLISITNGIDELNQKFNLDVQFAGLFMTKVDKRTSRFKQLNDGYTEQLENVYIPISVRRYDSVGKSATVFMPLLEFDKQCPAVQDYIEICNYEGLIDQKHYRKLTKFMKGGK